MVIGAFDDYASPIAERMRAERDEALAAAPLKQQARQLLSERLQPAVSGISLQALSEAAPDTRARVEELAREVVATLRHKGLAGQGTLIDDAQAEGLRRFLSASQFGLGELEYLFHEPDVEDIVINTAPVTTTESRVTVWTYRQSGKRREAVELDPRDAIELINRSVAHQGRKLDPTTPILNAQMRNGARVNAVLDPVCDPLLSATIRIHRLVARSFDDLVRFGTLTDAAASWLWLCVRARLALVVGGGTSSGKTNFLNAIARVTDPNERVVAIEDTRELDLAVEDKVYLCTVQSPDSGRAVTQRQLVANALRMRPDRIVLGEVRDAAAWDAIKAASTGHEGTLLTVHAEDAEGVVTRLARLAREAPETANLPEQTVKEAVASAFQCVVFLRRFPQPDGSFRRCVIEIAELNGFVNDGVVNQKLLFKLTNGRLEWTRQWPHERTRQRILDAGFTQGDIEAALAGRAQLWQSG